ncbi:hypothetical protein GEMRC1_004778 [Eukaryota sp. GEM-RC1]
MEEQQPQYPLARPWNLFFTPANSGGGYAAEMELVVTVSDAVKFVSVLRSLPPLNNFANGSSLFFFSDDIQPAWEDERNANGGRFKYTVAPEKLQENWENLLYLVVGQQLGDLSNIINGFAFLPKKNGTRIDIWLSDCDETHIRAIADFLKQDPHLKFKGQGLFFTAHHPDKHPKLPKRLTF